MTADMCAWNRWVVMEHKQRDDWKTGRLSLLCLFICVFLLFFKSWKQTQSTKDISSKNDEKPDIMEFVSTIYCQKGQLESQEKMKTPCCYSCWPSTISKGVQGGVRHSVLQGISWDRSLGSWMFLATDFMTSILASPHTREALNPFMVISDPHENLL